MNFASDFRKKLPAALAVGAGIALLAALPVAGAASASSVPAPVPPANLRPDDLRVMTFNLRYGLAHDGRNSWPHRKELLIQTIRDFHPDLLGTQEVLKFQAEFLRERLPEYAFHGVGREDGREAGEYSPVMWRRARFERVDGGHFWLSETPAVPGSKSWDSSLPRMVSWVLLRDRRAGGRKLIYANTHWDHRGPRARLESARLIRRRAAGAFPGIPGILTGDFNTTEDRAPYALLVRGEGVSDTLRVLDVYRVVHPRPAPDEATFNGWKPVTRGQRIDWILCTPQFQPLWAEINRRREGDLFPSDHYPVEAILRWKH